MVKKVKKVKKTKVKKTGKVSTAKAKKTKSAKVKKSKKVKKAKVVKKAKKKATAVPNGYHSITPYLIVDRAAEAIDFYQKAFGAKVVMRMEKPDGRIGHAELKIGDAKIMLADECPEMNAQSPKAFNGSAVSIHLYIKNVDDVVENALVAGAMLKNPVEDMFYGDRAGTIVDPFGHVWHVSTHVEDLTQSQIRKRASAMYQDKMM